MYNSESTLRELIYKLKQFAIQSHTYCEDSWYSCPKAPDGCSNDSKGSDCDCGADATNRKIELLMKEIENKLK